MSQDVLVLQTNDQVSERSTTSSKDTALVVDLDGTLVRTDLLYESFFAALPNGFKHNSAVIGALFRGKAHLKAYLAGVAVLDYALLPYNAAVVELIRNAKKDGRRVYLATASDRRHAERIAEHLGQFDGIFASDGETNLSGEAKARQLIEKFGDGSFDYVGNEDRDVAIWAHARKAYIVSNSPALMRKVEELGIAVERIDSSRPPLRTWLRALRVHQYVKNLLAPDQAQAAFRLRYDPALARCDRDPFAIGSFLRLRSCRLAYARRRAYRVLCPDISLFVEPEAQAHGRRCRSSNALYDTSDRGRRCSPGGALGVVTRLFNVRLHKPRTGPALCRAGGTHRQGTAGSPESELPPGRSTYCRGTGSSERSQRRHHFRALYLVLNCARAIPSS